MGVGRVGFAGVASVPLTLSGETHRHIEWAQPQSVGYP